VNHSDKIDHARAWLFAERLLLDDEVARLEAMSEEELDAQLRADGIDPGGVPSLETLLARAGALAKAALAKAALAEAALAEAALAEAALAEPVQAHPGGREGLSPEGLGEIDHARGWAHVESLLAADDAARDAENDAAHGAEGAPSLEWLMARATELAKEQAPGDGTGLAGEQGPDDVTGLAREPAPDDGVVQAVDARAPEPARVSKAGPNMRRLRPVWLLTAVLGAMVSVFAVMNGAVVVALFRGDDIRPDDEWLPWKPSPTPLQRAAAARDTACTACASALWDTCEAKLDEARTLDPMGESAPAVVAARKSIEDAGKVPKAPLKPKPKPEPQNP
jgi:hypothetical protein